MKITDPAPPMYDVETTLVLITETRKRSVDPLTKECARIGHKLAANIGRHFTAHEKETAGTALVIAAASLDALLDADNLKGRAALDVQAFCGERLVLDAIAEAENP